MTVAKTYEAMFLMDPALATDWPAAEAEIKRILDRAEARLLGMKNWDERKLAYSMGTHKRGLYVLTYFEAPVDRIAGLERDVQLSEKMLRVLVLRREGMSAEAIQKALAAPPPPKTPIRGGDEWGSGRPRFGERGGEGREGGGRAPEAAVAVEEAAEVDVLES
jgi:ribosomal protein S6